MSGRIAQCLSLLSLSAGATLLSGGPAAAQAQDFLNVKVQLQISADCGGHPQIVNSSATGQFRPTFNPTGVAFNGNLEFQANPTDFSCPRTYYNSQTNQSVEGEERFAVAPQRPGAFTSLTIIWPSQYMRAQMTNLMVGLKIGRCTSADYANGQKIHGFTTTEYGVVFNGGTQEGRPDGNVSPTLSLTQADASNGFSGTYTIKGIGACGESGLGERTDPSPWTLTGRGHMLEATAVVTLNYKSANQVEVAIAPCADIVAGQSASVQAKATPAGGQYDWTGSGGVQVRGAGASATVTGAQPGRGRVQVRYTAPNGRSASDDKPVTCLRVKGLNGGAPIPQIGLYDEEGKKISTPTIVALSVEPADAGDRLSFKAANAALLSVLSRGDALMLQGVQPGKTQITGKTSCDQSVGAPWPVEVRRCTDDVVAKLAEQERIARQEVLRQVAEANRALDSQQFKDAADGLGKASGDVILKTGAMITGTLGGGARGATRVVSDLIGHAVNIRDIVNAEDNWDSLSANLQEFVQSEGGPVSQTVAGAIDLLKTAADFGDKLGKVMGTNEMLESIRKNIDNFQRQHEDIVRRQKICKESQGQPPQEPEPQKPKPGPKPAPPQKTPSQPPSAQPPATPPAQPPEPPGEEPPNVPPPPYQPPPQRTVGLPFNQSCTCGAGRGLSVSASGLATLQTGLKQMNSCNTGFADQTRAFQGALEAFGTILNEMSHAREVPPALRAARAKEWSARLGTVVDKSKKFEAAGKAVLQNGKACPAAMDASLGMMTVAATSPLTAR